MKVHKHDLKERLIKTALRSTCKYKIAAFGLNARGTVMQVATNLPRFSRFGGGDHAEALIMKSSPRSLRTIIICRVNKEGALLPIHPCKACAALAEKLGIKIQTVED